MGGRRSTRQLTFERFYEDHVDATGYGYPVAAVGVAASLSVNEVSEIANDSAAA